MHQIKLDCTSIHTKEELHKALSGALAFPQWYGNNLDALYDCLTDLEAPVHLILCGWEQLPPWKIAFHAVFSDAQNACPVLTVSFH